MMKRQLAQLCAVAGLTIAATAIAHNPAETDFGHAATAKLVPTTCDQLADNLNYSDDVSNPDIKVLKAGCDEKAKAADATTAAPPTKAESPNVEPAKPEHIQGARQP